MLFLIHLTMSVDSEQQCSSSRQSHPGSIVTKLLLAVICWTAFVQRHSVRKPLQQPYDGPYQILSRADKHFTLDVNGKKAVIISLDWVKPVYLDLPPSTLPPDPPQYNELVTDHYTKTMSTEHTTTHSCRCVYWSKCLSSYIPDLHWRGSTCGESRELVIMWKKGM